MLMSDGKKTIDFVLVCKLSQFKNDPEKHRMLETYLNNLRALGLTVEKEFFLANDDVFFVKIHINDDSVYLYSDLCSTTLGKKTVPNVISTRRIGRCLETPLTQRNDRHPIYLRYSDSIYGLESKKITSAERILTVYELLVKVYFGSERDQFGLDQLMHEKLICDYYPIHEGPYHWTETGLLSDRQLLKKYWGSYKMWCKEQPLNLVEKYYGPEYSFYFAWVDLYSKMLVLPAILSIFVLMYGLATLHTDENIRSKEICQSELLLCPRCLRCKYEFLKSNCRMSNFSYAFDNVATYLFAGFISIWSTVFMELWQRREAVLRLRWNLKYVDHDTTARSAFVRKAKYFKYSNVTGHDEPFIPSTKVFTSYFITVATVIFSFILIILCVIGVMIYRITVNSVLIKSTSTQKILMENRQMIASASGAAMSATFIISFKQIFKRLALKLTELENHRTQFEFDNAFIYKIYGFEFINNYAAPIYIAFFKGRFFTHPGELQDADPYKELGSDICDTVGCTLDLCIQLIMIMVAKTVVSNVTQYLVPIVLRRLKYFFKNVQQELPYYQEEFLLARTRHFFLVDEYVEQVILFGFMVFFIAAFPIGPFLAFITCTCELRTDSSKLIKNYRRPIPQKVTGLGAWFRILHLVTFLGVATNAFVIAFTTNMVDLHFFKAYYRDSHFINTTLSAFAIEDFPIDTPKLTGYSWCYYPGRRYPPDHPRKYQLTTEYWHLLGIRFMIVVIFEHVIMLLKGIVSYIIPALPTSAIFKLHKDSKEKP
ncbi:unnamed protein product [Phyllotreta striolata]|uniref:Anoctamin n=1 Tax=Phyllotreta striolata TaxID=444603 RepID=A0A9N9TMA5_PHYSR|nr:unnamed protein product [Phyllotreta striolata]